MIVGVCRVLAEPCVGPTNFLEKSIRYCWSAGKGAINNLTNSKSLLTVFEPVYLNYFAFFALV